VHQGMGISNVEFDAFNKELLGVMASAGVTPADRAVVLAVLETTRNLVVVPLATTSAATSATVTSATTTGSATSATTTGPVTSATTTSVTSATSATVTPTPAVVVGSGTFCDKYASALGLSQVSLVGAVVDGTVAKAIDINSPLLKYFDGTKPPGSTNFLAASSKPQLLTLRGSLVAFFGSALKCSDPTFPKYTGPTDLLPLHTPMGITKGENDVFTSAVIATLMGYGVQDAGDIQAAKDVLASVANQIVSDGSSKNTSGGTIGGLQTWQIGVIAAVGLAVVVAIIVVIVCCIKRGKGEGSNYVAF